MINKIVDRLIASVDCCPWGAHAYGSAYRPLVAEKVGLPLGYSPSERLRRDASPWTTVQAVLAPVQFAVFLVSLALVLHYLMSGQGLQIATASILLKTCLLLLIMVTGAIWERDVFGQYLFAPAFFWEDVLSFVVIGLHCGYVAVLLTGAASPRAQMLIVLAAYLSYLINAGQFLMKLRAFRPKHAAPPGGLAG